MNDFIKNIIDKLVKIVKAKPYKYGFFIALIFLAIPILIWGFYQIGNTGFGLPTNIKAGEALGFYGSFLSFLGAVALGGLALWQNKKYKEENDCKYFLGYTRDAYLQEKEFNRKYRAMVSPIKTFDIITDFATKTIKQCDRQEIIFKQKLQINNYNIDNIFIYDLYENFSKHYLKLLDEIKNLDVRNITNIKNNANAYSERYTKMTNIQSNYENKMENQFIEFASEKNLDTIKKEFKKIKESYKLKLENLEEKKDD